jgi:hypothetical protein
MRRGRRRDGMVPVPVPVPMPPAGPERPDA